MSRGIRKSSLNAKLTVIMQQAAKRGEDAYQAYADAKMRAYHEDKMRAEADIENWQDVEGALSTPLAKKGVLLEELNCMENPELAALRGEDTVLVRVGVNSNPGFKVRPGGSSGF